MTRDPLIVSRAWFEHCAALSLIGYEPDGSPTFMGYPIVVDGDPNTIALRVTPGERIEVKPPRGE